MRWVCGFCEKAFDAEGDDPPCPNCLRRRAAPKGRPRRAAVGDLRAVSEGPPPKRSLGASALRFAGRAAMGMLLFFFLTLRGRLFGVALDETWMRVYAVVLGGLLLGAGWTLYPRLAPDRDA